METDSENWRAECEARWVMRLPKQEREAFYAEVVKHRGVVAKDKLRADVNRLWREKGQAVLSGCES